MLDDASGGRNSLFESVRPFQLHLTARHAHAILAAAASHNPGFQTVIFPGSPEYALSLSVTMQVPRE